MPPAPSGLMYVCGLAYAGPDFAEILPWSCPLDGRVSSAVRERATVAEPVADSGHPGVPILLGIAAYSARLMIT